MNNLIFGRVYFADGKEDHLEPQPYTTQTLIDKLYSDDVGAPITDIVLSFKTESGTPAKIAIQPNGIRIIVNGEDI